MDKIYIIDLYESSIVGNHVKHIGYTTNKEIADKYLDDYADNEDYYIVVTESASLDNQI